MYMYIYTSSCIPKYIYTNIHFSFTHVYIYIYIYICICTYTYIQMYIHIHIYTYTNRYAYIHTYMHTYMNVCMHTYINTYIHICIYIYIYVSGILAYTCICMYIYTSTSTYIYIHIICIHIICIHIYIYTSGFRMSSIRARMHNEAQQQQSPEEGFHRVQDRCHEHPQGKDKPESTDVDIGPTLQNASKHRVGPYRLSAFLAPIGGSSVQGWPLSVLMPCGTCQLIQVPSYMPKFSVGVVRYSDTLPPFREVPDRKMTPVESQHLTLLFLGHSELSRFGKHVRRTYSGLLGAPQEASCK